MSETRRRKHGETRDERVWMLCDMLGQHVALSRDAIKPFRCKDCPEWIDDPEHGKLKLGCRLGAEELFNIATTGNVLAEPVEEMKERTR